MNKITIVSFLIFTSILCASSCASIKRPDGNKGILQGMLYDYDNRPVCGYRISLDMNKTTVTDINGRFSFTDIKFGLHEVSGEGTEHIPYAGTFAFNDKTQILYIRVASNPWLYVWIDKQLLEGNFFEAKKSLDLFSKAEKETRKFSLYHAIYNYRTSSESENRPYLDEANRYRRAVP